LDVSNRISVRFRSVLYSHILNNDFYRRNQYAQACVHHLVTDVKSLSEFTGETVFMGVRGIFFLLGGIGCLLYYSPYLSLISVGIMSVFNLLFRSRNTLLKQLKAEENEALIKITEFVGEKFHSLRLIKISNTEYFEKYKFAQ
jgi:ABC-type multidrug transport system fused ATPase/permease subunit